MLTGQETRQRRPKLGDIQEESNGRHRNKYSFEDSEELAENPQRKVQIRRLQFDELAAGSQHVLMGAIWKSNLTGECRLLHTAYETFKDFSIVDLWTRKILKGTPQMLGQDWYLFRPRPLSQRTWLYHACYSERLQLPDDETKKKKEEPGSHETKILRWVLAQWCVDADIIGGRWTPTIAYVFVAFFVSLTSDLVLVFIAHCVFFGVYLLSGKCAKHAFAYKWTRTVTVPLRLVMFCSILVRLPAVMSKGGLAVLGATGAIVGIVVDVLAGDVVNFISYRYACSYELIGQLPGRVFICRKEGGPGSFDDSQEQQEKIKSEWNMDQRLALLGSTVNGLTLIADVQGILVELLPAKAEDFATIMEEHTANIAGVHEAGAEPKPDHYFLGLDVFNPRFPTLRAHREEEERLREIQMRNAFFAERRAKNIQQQVEREAKSSFLLPAGVSAFKKQN